MTEAVRFYWRGRDASIPLGEIPPEDRNPLRVRRSVVQSYTPDVIKQLEEGRFVAAAWETNRQIYLVGCHPNLAKGTADTLLVDTRALPQVVLRPNGWDQVPDAAHLYLRAFGSEALTGDECAAARRELIAWLAATGQPQMAQIVKRYISFPFGVRSDALEIINTWRNVVVKGQKDQIDQFLGEVDQRFARFGWSRDGTVQAQMNRGENRMSHHYCWINGQDARPRVMLCLNRTTDRRVRGGTYNIDSGAALAVLAKEIQFALQDVLEPAAIPIGLVVACPRLGPISRVGPNTESALTAFAKDADGEWPIPQHSELLWRGFVLTAFREDVAFKPEELTAWFVASGWDEPDASAIANRFYADIALIAEYEEAGRQPA